MIEQRLTVVAPIRPKNQDEALVLTASPLQGVFGIRAFVNCIGKEGRVFNHRLSMSTRRQHKNNDEQKATGHWVHPLFNACTRIDVTLIVKDKGVCLHGNDFERGVRRCRITKKPCSISL